MRNFTMEDFAGAGHYLIRNDKGPGEYIDPGFMSTILKKVGYCLGQGLEDRTHRGNVYTLTDMSDGLTSLGYFDTRKDPEHGKNPRRCNTEFWIWVQFNGVQSLCDYLNNPDLCEQEYRFATQEEVVRVVMYQKARWR